MAAEAVLDGGQVTGVTAFNDRCAAGVLSQVRARGVRVPADLSLVGYDDSHLASLSSVALTTVAQDASILAGNAVELALSRAAEPDREATEVVVPPTLVVRETSGRPAAQD